MVRLLMSVKEMQDRENWLQARNAGIGGSDAAVILGMSEWKGPWQLWMEKTGQSEPEDLSDNERVYWGTMLEDLVAREFSKRTGMKVSRRGLLQSDRYPWMLASVDRMIVGEDAGLECKTAGSGAEWKDDEIPDAYYCQCQHYMAVTGANTWYIAALIGGNRFIWKEVPRNDDEIKVMVEAEKEFWRHVEDRTPPPVDGTESCARALAERYHGGGDMIWLPDEAEEAIKQIDALTAEEKDLKERIEFHKNKLREMLGNAESGCIAGRKVTWKTQAGRVTIDAKRLQAEKPEVYAEYVKQGAPIRVLRIGR